MGGGVGKRAPYSLGTSHNPHVPRNAVLPSGLVIVVIFVFTGIWVVSFCIWSLLLHIVGWDQEISVIIFKLNDVGRHELME